MASGAVPVKEELAGDRQDTVAVAGGGDDSGQEVAASVGWDGGSRLGHGDDFDRLEFGAVTAAAEAAGGGGGGLVGEVTRPGRRRAVPPPAVRSVLAPAEASR